MKLFPISFLDKGFDLFFDILKVCAHNVLIDCVNYKGSKIGSYFFGKYKMLGIINNFINNGKDIE